MLNWSRLADRMTSIVVGSFGRPVTYQIGSSPSFTVNGVVQRMTEEERHVGGLYAQLLVQAASFSTPPDEGHHVVIDGVTYVVIQALGDESGGVTLTLRAGG